MLDILMAPGRNYKLPWPSQLGLRVLRFSRVGLDILGRQLELGSRLESGSVTVPGTAFIREWLDATRPVGPEPGPGLRQVGKVGLTYSDPRAGVWSARSVGTVAGGQSGQTFDVSFRQWASLR